MKHPRLRIARPRGAVKCICFLAAPALVAAMVAAGLSVRLHPLHPDRYVVPDAQVSELTLRDLISRHDFIFLSTVAFLASPTGSNQTYTSDATWNNANNKIEVIGAGASGAAAEGTGATKCTGGGGGEWGRISNFSFATPGTTTAVYQIGTAGTAVAKGSNTAASGVSGGDTWFGGATQAGSSVGGIGGTGGNFADSTHTANGGAGGTGGVGTNHAAGGRGGNLTLSTGITSCTGGGGAGGSGLDGLGSSGTGNDGVDSGSDNVRTAGGQGDGVYGGTGTAGATVPSNGNPGTEWDGSHGSGGGGGSTNASGNTAGSGGNYGAGGGGARGGVGTSTSGAGAGGLIILSWGTNIILREALDAIGASGRFFSTSLEGIG